MRYGMMNREFMEGQMRRGAISEREYRNYRWKMRRQREVRNRLLLLAFTVALILGMAISYHSIISYAETEPENLSFKYYTQIELEYGDSLWSIAKEYADSHYDSISDYICEVKSINHLHSDVVKEGQVLVVPYYSAEFRY